MADLNKKLICIDPGHGGKDSGAVNGLRYEKNDNLRFAFALKKELENQGFAVLLTRTDDSSVSLQERTDLANKNNADYFISVHRNAFTNAQANGVENWIYTTASAASSTIAQLILDEVIKVGAQENRGVKKGNFHVTRESKMPACLLELGFISNEKDNELYDKNFEKYAAAIAKGICTYYGITFKDTTQTVVVDDASDRIYRVQVGAFKNKENAQKLVEQLKQLGYTSFIV